MSHFLSYGHSKNKIEVELDLSKYATKSNLKSATGADTSQFVKKDDLTNLKREVDKLDINKLPELDADKLKPAPIDLKKKLSNVVDKKVVKKDACDVLVKKVYIYLTLYIAFLHSRKPSRYKMRIKFNKDLLDVEQNNYLIKVVNVDNWPKFLLRNFTTKKVLVWCNYYSKN